MVILSVCSQSASLPPGSYLDFLLVSDCECVIPRADNAAPSLSVLEGGEKGSLPVVATVFDKLNQVYKEYLEAEQTYTVVSEKVDEFSQV